MKLAVIGGTGFDSFEALGEGTPLEVETPFGTVQVSEHQLEERTVYFLPRHGADHSVAPHLINYRANITALKQLGVRSIVATAACGAITEMYEVEDMTLLAQFIDFTKQRPLSLFEQADHPIHVDLTTPYCPRLASIAKQAALEAGIKLKRDAIYVCTEGPRFETSAEIQAYRRLGADVVGMTQVPEVVMAREAEMCYVALGLVTNLAAGRSPGYGLSHSSIEEVLNRLKSKASKLIKALLLAEEDVVCQCHYALFEEQT